MNICKSTSFFKKTQKQRPFPSCLLPHFKNKYLCKTIEMKMTLISMKMDSQVKHILITGSPSLRYEPQLFAYVIILGKYKSLYGI